MSEATREALRQASRLGVFTLVVTTILAGTYTLTGAIVAANEAAAREALIAQTLPPGAFDNQLGTTRRLLPPEAVRELGAPAEASLYTARLHGRISGHVFETAAPNGYGGRIRLLVGIRADGRLGGVRVIAHRETPGLGDYIDPAKSPWARQFEGLPARPGTQWKVKKDGGQIDYMAGATISARAVAGAVARTVAYYHAHHDALVSD